MAHVLLADDVKGILKAVERILIKDGHTVDCCTDGEVAMKMAFKNKYDLVITDILMPEKDGLELSKYIRTELPDDKKDVPIVAITGGGSLISSEIVIETAKIYTNAILQKPFDSEGFRKVVSQFLD